eukprot:s955_g20.t1
MLTLRNSCPEAGSEKSVLKQRFCRSLHLENIARHLRWTVEDIAALADFNRWLGELSHRHRVLVAGNHDGALRDLRAAGVKRLLGHCTYLEDPVKSVRFISCPSKGLKIHGSSKAKTAFWCAGSEDSFKSCWQRVLHPRPLSAGSSPNGAFQNHVGIVELTFKVMPAVHGQQPRPRSQSGYDEAKAVSAVPEGLDILVTHGPAGEGALGRASECLQAEKPDRPRVHIFGHYHLGHGVACKDGVVQVNASRAQAHASRCLV